MAEPTFARPMAMSVRVRRINTTGSPFDDREPFG